MSALNWNHVIYSERFKPSAPCPTLIVCKCCTSDRRFDPSLTASAVWIVETDPAALSSLLTVHGGRICGSGRPADPPGVWWAEAKDDRDRGPDGRPGALPHHLFHLPWRAAKNTGDLTRRALWHEFWTVSATPSFIPRCFFHMLSLILRLKMQVRFPLMFISCRKSAVCRCTTPPLIHTVYLHPKCPSLQANNKLLCQQSSQCQWSVSLPSVMQSFSAGSSDWC